MSNVNLFGSIQVAIYASGLTPEAAALAFAMDIQTMLKSNEKKNVKKAIV